MSWDRTPGIQTDISHAKIILEWSILAGLAETDKVYSIDPENLPLVQLNVISKYEIN